MNARRFGSPVSASVSASWRARRSIRRLSRKDSAIRPTASAIAVAASTTPSVLTEWIWS